MINPELHKKPVALDREKHRQLKLRMSPNPIQAAAGLNAFFVTAPEFGDVCKEYPLLFLRAGNDAQGRPQAAPVAVFGLSPGENLFIGQGAWQGRYAPAMLRVYPFAMARVDNQLVLCIDESWQGFSTTEGQPLFEPDGTSTPYLTELQKFVEQIEADVERTRLCVQRYLELDLLRDKRFDATLPDGTPLSVDGFMAIDEDKLAALSDADLLQLQRSGLLGLLHAHMISLSNMGALVNRRLLAQAAAAGAAATPLNGAAASLPH
jgi:hypothetical protein